MHSEMLKRFERTSKDFLKSYYSSVDMLRWELDYLNDSLALYNMRKLGNSEFANRKAEIKDIRRRIPEIYDAIRYYNECINAEKQEMNRLYELAEQLDANSTEYYDEPETDYDYRYDKDVLEEVKEYKYNYVWDKYE